MLNSVLNTLSYSILYLSKTFLNVDNEPPQPATVFSFGHSLGGGLSTLFSLKYVGIHDILPDIDKPFLNPNIICLSNAAPRVLNKTAMETFMVLVLAGRIKFLRQWTKGDWVPTVPQQNLGYFHPKKGDVVTTLKLKQTWNKTSPYYVAYEKSLEGRYGDSTGSFTSTIAHSFQTYINFWPVLTGFSLGSQVSKKKSEKSDLAQEQQLDSITLKLVLIENSSEKQFSVRSIEKQIAEKPVGEKLSTKIDFEVSSYEWFERNLIGKMTETNQLSRSERLSNLNYFPKKLSKTLSLPKKPLDWNVTFASPRNFSPPLVEKSMIEYNQAEKDGANFATATCLKHSGGKNKKSKRKNKKKSISKKVFQKKTQRKTKK